MPEIPKRMDLTNRSSPLPASIICDFFEIISPFKISTLYQGQHGNVADRSSLKAKSSSSPDWKISFQRPSRAQFHRSSIASAKVFSLFFEAIEWPEIGAGTKIGSFQIFGAKG